jgi:PBP1b-binding outer membrane lipoprotein LpoB
VDNDTMKKTTLFLILLVAFSTILIAGCTQQQPVVTPAPKPAVTAVPTYVQNQQGVAIIRTVNVTASPTVAPTVAVQANQTVAVKTNQTVAVKTNQTTAIVTNKT